MDLVCQVLIWCATISTVVAIISHVRLVIIVSVNLELVAIECAVAALVSLRRLLHQPSLLNLYKSSTSAAPIDVTVKSHLCRTPEVIAESQSRTMIFTGRHSRII